MSRRIVLTFVFTAVALAIGVPTVAADQTVSGSTVNLTDSQEDLTLSELEAAIERSGRSVPSNATILRTGSGRTYFVVTDEPIQTASATVSGPVITQAGPDSPGLIYGESITYDRDGAPVELTELLANPDDYDGEYVAISGTISDIGYTLDAAENTYTRQSGVLTVASETAFGPDISLAGRDARTLVKNLNTSSTQYARTQVLQLATNQTIGFSTDRPLWTGRADGTVHGVVRVQSGTPTLSVGRVEYNSTEVASVDELSDHSGELVTVEADAVGARISTQETLLSVAQCAPSSVTFPAVGCLPVPADTVVHTGVAVEGTPDGPSDVVYYVGQSNREQGTPVISEAGRYELTGRVVDASDLDPRLNGTGLMIVDRKQVSGGIAESTRDEASEYRDTAREYLRDQITANESEWTAVVNEANSEPAPSRETSTPTATPTSQPDESDSQNQQADSDSFAQDTPIATTTGSSGGWLSDFPPWTIAWLISGLCVFTVTVGLLNKSLSVYDDMSDTVLFACGTTVAVIGSLAVIFGKEDPTGILILVGGGAAISTTLSIPVFIFGSLWAWAFE